MLGFPEGIISQLTFLMPGNVPLVTNMFCLKVRKNVYCFCNFSYVLQQFCFYVCSKYTNQK